LKLHVAAWPKIGGVKYAPGDEVEVEDEALARMLIRDGQCRQAGTPEPLPLGRRGSDAPPPEDGATDTGSAGVSSGPPSAPARPGRGASKDEWVAYAVTQGLGREEAEGMNRAELTARFAGN
jgi:hypothetical protein